ncbi:hypothetical protein [Lacunimicrobium album]
MAGWLRLLIVMILLPGCGSRGHQELLESRLRAQEEQLAMLETQLSTNLQELAYARKENQTLQERLDASSPGSTAFVSAQSRVEKIVIDPLYTGLNRVNNKRTLVLFFTPQDGLEKPVKLPGDVTIQLRRADQSESSPPLEQWDLTSQSCIKYWQDGFIKSGFLFQVEPTTDLSQMDQISLKLLFATSPSQVLEAKLLVKTNTATESFPGGLSAQTTTPNPKTAVVDSATAESEAGTAKVEPASFKTESNSSMPEWANIPGDLKPVEGQPRLEPLPETTREKKPTVTSDNWTDESTPVWR